MNTATHFNYFAYGSNMSLARLQARIPNAQQHCVARVESYRLAFNKCGLDDSGKCNIVATGNPEDVVYGVVFQFPVADKTILDGYEGPRYHAVEISLLDEENSSLTAFCYLVKDLDQYTDDKLLPYDWYHQHVVFGAREANLPGSYLALLDDVKTMTDQNSARREKELSIYR